MSQRPPWPRLGGTGQRSHFRRIDLAQRHELTVGGLRRHGMFSDHLQQRGGPHHTGARRGWPWLGLDQPHRITGSSQQRRQCRLRLVRSIARRRKRAVARIDPHRRAARDRQSGLAAIEAIPDRAEQWIAAQCRPPTGIISADVPNPAMIGRALAIAAWTCGKPRLALCAAASCHTSVIQIASPSAASLATI